jgi:molybdate transport system substrate-binding protein
MKKICLLVSVFLTFVFLKDAQSSSARMLVFAGAASKPATEETVRIFQERFGIPVDVVFGGSGFVPLK